MEFLTAYDYQGKGFGLSLCDTLLSPLYYTLGSQKITCIDSDTGAKADVAKASTLPHIQFIQSRKSEGMISLIYRACAALLAVALLPLTVAAIVGKACAVSQNEPLKKRFIEHKIADKFTLEDRAAGRIWCKCVEGVATQFAYDKLQQTAHIQADVQMTSKYQAKQAMPDMDETDFQKLSSNAGGLFFISARMLREHLEKYKDNPEIGDEIKKALKSAHEYEKWSSRMLSVMPFRFIHVAPTGLIQDIALDLQDRLRSLEKGESFIVPVNLRPAFGGFHTITVRMKKEQDGTFSFTVYNLGLGANNHQHGGRFGKPTVYPFRIENIDPEKMTNVSLLTKFINQATFEHTDDDIATGFYTFLNRADWGRDAKVNQRSSLFQTATLPSTLQRSGVCIWKSILEAMKDQMPLDVYKRFVFAMKRDNIVEVYQQYLKRDIENAEDLSPVIKLPRWQGEKQQARVLLAIAIAEFNKRLEKQGRKADPEGEKRDALMIKKLKIDIDRYMLRTRK